LPPPSHPADPPLLPLAAWWLFWKGDGNATNGVRANGGGRASARGMREADLMHRTVRMMEECRRSQEATKRAFAVMDELLGAFVMGRSAASLSGGGGILGIVGDGTRRGGVKVTFNGHRRPVAVKVNLRFLFPPSPALPSNVGGGGGDNASALQGAGGGVISAEELNNAIADKLRDGYKRSGRVMEDKLRRLYKQLGLSRDPAPLPSNKLQE
jgi:hypothetical protein